MNGLSRLVTPSAVAWLSCGSFLLSGQGAWAQSGAAVTEVKIDGQSLKYWVKEAVAEQGPQELERTVAALSRAVRHDNPKVKMKAAEAEPAIQYGGGDWPQFHGPARDSLCREEGLLQKWPPGGPPLLWTLTASLCRCGSSASRRWWMVIESFARPAAPGQPWWRWTNRRAM